MYIVVLNNLHILETSVGSVSLRRQYPENCVALKSVGSKPGFHFRRGGSEHAKHANHYRAHVD